MQRDNAYFSIELGQADEQRLLNGFPARFGEHPRPCHITYEFGVNLFMPRPRIGDVDIVGYCTDNVGMEAFIVRVDGHYRGPDGRNFHLTWSYDPGARVPVPYIYGRDADGGPGLYKPMYANTLLKANEWRLFDTPYPLQDFDVVFSVKSEGIDLPHDPDSYFTAPEGAFDVPLRRLQYPDQDKGTRMARTFMARAFRGETDPRKPISVRPIGGELYEVDDGVATTLVAQGNNWPTVRAKIEP